MCNIFSNTGLNSRSYKQLKCPLLGEQVNRYSYPVRYHTGVKMTFSCTHLTNIYKVHTMFQAYFEMLVAQE